SEHHLMGGWLVADPTGKVTAHRGMYVGQGGPWELAGTIVAGSAAAVNAPVLTGYHRDHPDEHEQRLACYQTAMQRLLERHDEALAAGNLYAIMRSHPDPCFVPLLRAAISDRATQLILHDWLADRDFPHVEELRSKRWNQG